LTAFRAVAALLFLNAVLGFQNWNATPGIRPDWKLAPELVLLWVVLLAVVKAVGTVSRGLVTGLALVCLLLVIGRYVDVTAPVLFGRPVNLYWDLGQIPRFLAVTSQQLPAWQLGLAILGVALVAWALFRALHFALTVAARDAAPLALRSRTALGATIVAVAVVLASTTGVEAARQLVAKPVTPTYLRQADLLVSAFSPARLAVTLPPSPAFDSDLGMLDGVDVKLLFLESYGATLFDNPASRGRLAAPREALAQAIASTGRQVVSAFVRSPTFGGASDLAHLGLLSGMDLTDPFRHDLLLTTGRPTLVDLFRAHGYETFGFYPALSWHWPEAEFYRFDRLVDGPALRYQGPHLGPWWIPDQYSIARFDELHPIGPGTPPRLLFFPTISSHFPFWPVPPYQPDWSRVLSSQPFDEHDVARALAEKIAWADLSPAYVRTIDYTYTWLAGYLRRPSPRDYLLVLIGDHQPVGSVTGPAAPWDVPVHVITSDEQLLQRLTALGFRPGLEPQRPILGAMHELTQVLLDAFDSRLPVAALARRPAGDGDRLPTRSAPAS